MYFTFWGSTMRFSSNGSSSLCSKVEGEVVCSSPTECMCNLPIKKEEDILGFITAIMLKLGITQSLKSITTECDQ
jgi:hypothetical protein